MSAWFFVGSLCGAEQLVFLTLPFTKTARETQGFSGKTQNRKRI